MENKTKLVWIKQEESNDATFYQSFIGDIKINYKIAVRKSGEVCLGVLRTNADLVKSHPSHIPIYPNFTENSMYDFIIIYDKTKMVVEKGETPNSFTINGFEIDIPKFEIAKQMAQDMFDQEVQYFRNMMKICGT